MAPRRFLIVGKQRSGTTVTQAVLNAHPLLSTSAFEVKVDLFSEGLSLFTYGHYPYASLVAAIPAMFDALASLGAPPGGGGELRAIGLKVAIAKHDHAVDLANALREFLRDVAIIVVEREDLVAQFGSLKRAEATGQWHGWGRTEKLDRMVTLDREALLDYARDAIRTTAQLETLAATHDVLRLRYEQEIAAGHFDPLFAFLGVDPAPYADRIPSKVAPPPGDYIVDYAELRALVDALPRASAESELQYAAERFLAADRHRPTPFSLQRARALVQQGGPTLAAAVLRQLLERAGQELTREQCDATADVLRSITAAGVSPLLSDVAVAQLTAALGGSDEFLQWR
ncbi:MAG: hypothetical protein IPM29_20600 [Planctomycetes bacterium]|nr:hypothetical protein [Planctomycetota bacterium]